MYDINTVSAMIYGLGDALPDGVEPIYSESYGAPITLELTEEQEKFLREAGRNLVIACLQKYGKYIASEDLEQECMIEVIRAIKRFDPSRVDIKLSTFVWTYVRNRIFMAYRHTKTDKYRHEKEQLPESMLYSKPYFELGYEEIENWDEREYYFAWLKKAMEKLPDEYRMVLQLTVAGLHQVQIGQVLAGKSQSQVSRLKNSAVKRLQKILAEDIENRRIVING